GQTAIVRGWAVDAEDGAPIARVAIFADSEFAADATLGESRADVAAKLADPRFTNSGWTANLDTSALVTGIHLIRAFAYDSMGVSKQIDGERTITIVDPPSPLRPPIGSIEDVAGQASGPIQTHAVAVATGWAADP